MLLRVVLDLTFERALDLLVEALEEGVLDFELGEYELLQLTDVLEDARVALRMSTDSCRIHLGHHIWIS